MRPDRARLNGTPQARRSPRTTPPRAVRSGEPRAKASAAGEPAAAAVPLSPAFPGPLGLGHALSLG